MEFVVTAGRFSMTGTDKTRALWQRWADALTETAPIAPDLARASALAEAMTDPVVRDLLAAYGAGYSVEVLNDFADHIADGGMHEELREQWSGAPMLRVEVPQQERLLGWYEWVNDVCPTQHTLGGTAWALWTLGRNQVAAEAALTSRQIGESTMAALVHAAVASEFPHPAQV